MNKNQLAIILILVLLISAGVFYSFVWNEVDEYVNPNPPKKEVYQGERRQYTDDGKLKTIINYKDGKKHGQSTLFHRDGKTILLTLPYIMGKREGTSKKYYEDGSIYSRTNYRNNLLHGTRHVYYRSGKLKSIVHYYNGHPGLGTEEYLTNGKKKDQINITHTIVGNELRLTTSSDCIDTRFFIGSLIEDSYLNALGNDVIELPKKDGYHYLPLGQNVPHDKGVICSCKSSQNNPIILKTEIPD